jgi:hypothetical protein
MGTKSGQNFTHQNKTKMAKISHTKIKQPSVGEKRPKFSDLRGNNEKHGY